MQVAQFPHVICSAFVLMLCFCGTTEGYRGWVSTKKMKCLNPPRTARRVENFIPECQEEVKNKLVTEAFQILKEEVSKVQPPLDANDDSIDWIESIEAPPHYQPPTAPDDNDPHADSTHDDDEHAGDYNDEDDFDGYADAGEHHHKYQYQYADSPFKRIGRFTRLGRRLRRFEDMDVSSGIYHPTLVPFEDKRIAGCLLHCVYAKNNAIDKLGWPTLDGLVHFYSEGVNEHGFFMATLRAVNLCLRAVTSKYQVDRRKLPEKGESCDLAFDVFDCISDQITGYCLDSYRH